MALINSPEISEALKEGKRIINLTLKVEIVSDETFNSKLKHLFE